MPTPKTLSHLIHSAGRRLRNLSYRIPEPVYRLLAIWWSGGHRAIRYRRADLGDADAIYRLRRFYLREGIWPIGPATFVRRFEFLLERGFITLVADTGRAIVGTATVHPGINLAWESWRLAAVQVSPAYRRRGVAEALTRRALEIAFQEGATRVHVLTHRDNLAATRLYRKLGFLTTPTETATRGKTAYDGYRVFFLPRRLWENRETDAAPPPPEEPSMTPLDDADRAILNRIQSDFPITAEPFRTVAEELDLDPDEVIERVVRLKEIGIIRRIGGNFVPEKLGFVSTLCAARVPATAIDQFARTVNRYTGVTHNYQRDNDYNVWFTFIAPSMAEIEANLQAISAETGVSEIINLPATRVFKIKAQFDV